MDMKKTIERRKYLVEWHRKQRQERVKKGLCVQCGKKPEPVIPYRCRSCNDIQNKRNSLKTK